MTFAKPSPRATSAAAGDPTTGTSGIVFSSALSVGTCAWSSHPCESKITSAPLARSSHRSLSDSAFRPTYSAGMSKNVRSPTSQGSHRTRTFETRISANQLFPPRYVYRIAPVSVVSDDDDVDDVVVPSLVDGDDDARARRVADAARAARRGIDARAREDVDAAALVSDDANATDDMTSAALRGVQCICYVEDDDHVEREPESSPV